MKATERLQTSRLILRRPRREDAQAIFDRYASSVEVTRFLAWPRHQSIEQTAGFLDFSDAEWERWPAGPYLIESRASGALLGSTGFGFETPEQATTGYVLATDAWGKGYATEALTGLMALCSEIGLRRVYALCHVDHLASQRVLQKCGFRLEPTERSFDFPNLAPSPQPVVCYARTIS